MAIGLWGFCLSTGKCVYIVDDDPNIRAWAELVCEELGHRARCFAGGDEFIAALQNLEPGCILLDMRMPRRGGLQVQAELAKLQKPFPVIAMSGYGDVDVAVHSMKMGAIEFLEKPFGQEALKDALDRGFASLGEPPSA